MLLKLAWRNLWRNKLRTAITTAAVLFAVVLAVLMRSMQLGTYDRILNNMVSHFMGHIQVHKNGYWDDQTIDNVFTDNQQLIDSLKAYPNVENVVPRLESFALAATGNITKGVMVMGVSPQAETQMTGVAKQVVDGNYITADDDGILISEGLASYMKLQVADTLVMLGQGYHGVSAAGKYPIRGIVKLSNPDMNKATVYLPLAQAQTFYGAPGMVSSIALLIKKFDDAGVVTDQLRGYLGKQYEIMSWDEMMPDIKQAIEGDNASGIIMISVLYVIISFGIFGTILMMIAERQYEFGILISIGMKKFKLGITVVTETIIIVLMGTFTGFLLSIPIVTYFKYHPIFLTGQMKQSQEFFGFEAVMQASNDPGIFITQTTVVLAVSLLLCIYPLISISRIDPIKAMRR